jgi:hypothetical protein
MVETHDVCYDIQITIKWLYSWERWIGGQCLKTKTWDMKGFKTNLMSWKKKRFGFSLKMEWYDFHWLHEGEKISLMLWQWKTTYDHLVGGISKYVDGVPK